MNQGNSSHNVASGVHSLSSGANGKYLTLSPVKNISLLNEFIV